MNLAGQLIPTGDLENYDELLQQDQWIIDRFDSSDTVWEQLEVADTLIYLDTKLTPKYRAYVQRAKAMKQVYYLRSLQDIEQLYQTVALELAQ